MSQKVEISRGSFVVLILTLVGCLVAVAFLLGRESAKPVAAATPARGAPVVAMVQTAPPGKETPTATQPLNPGMPRARVERPATARPAVVAAVEVETASRPARRVVVRTERVASSAAETSGDYPQGDAASARSHSAPAHTSQAPAASSQPPAAKAPEKGDQAAVKKYLAQVDSAMANTQSMDDPNGFATQLLQQSMQGDSSGFDELIATSESALVTVGGISAPASCKEHHRLVMGQLKSGIGLLRQVKTATTTMDTAGLAALSTQGKGLQRDAARLAELDRQLRSN